MEKYGNTIKEGKRYAEDLRYWSNACGKLHMWGEFYITESELPQDLRRVYHDRYKEGKDNHLCYLAEYRGVYGIVLLEEMCSYTEANDVAEIIDKEFSERLGCTVILAKEHGFRRMTDLVVFVPTSVDKEKFNIISMEFAYEMRWIL